MPINPDSPDSLRQTPAALSGGWNAWRKGLTKHLNMTAVTVGSKQNETHLPPG